MSLWKIPNSTIIFFDYDKNFKRKIPNGKSICRKFFLETNINCTYKFLAKITSK